jgi:molecular chaperone Hsp33
LPDDWQRLGLLAATLRLADVNAGIGPGVLSRMLAEDDLRLFESRRAAFRCRCSRQRAEEVLRLLGEAEIRTVLAERGRIEVTCEYCGRRRDFDAVDVDALFTPDLTPPSDTLH